MPSPTSSPTPKPSSSGPRWRITSHMRCTRTRLDSKSNGAEGEEDSTNPAMPHMVSVPVLLPDVVRRRGERGFQVREVVGQHARRLQAQAAADGPDERTIHECHPGDGPAGRGAIEE